MLSISLFFLFCTDGLSRAVVSLYWFCFCVCAWCNLFLFFTLNFNVIFTFYSSLALSHLLLCFFLVIRFIVYHQQWCIKWNSNRYNSLVLLFLDIFLRLLLLHCIVTKEKKITNILKSYRERSLISSDDWNVKVCLMPFRLISFVCFRFSSLLSIHRFTYHNSDTCHRQHETQPAVVSSMEAHGIKLLWTSKALPVLISQVTWTEIEKL